MQFKGLILMVKQPPANIVDQELDLREKFFSPSAGTHQSIAQANQH
jgi:hypothetical protein